MTETLDPSKGQPTPEVKIKFREILKRDLARLATDGDGEAKSLLELIEKQDQAEEAKIGGVFDPDGDKTMEIVSTAAALRKTGRLRPLSEMVKEAEKSLKPNLM